MKDTNRDYIEQGQIEMEERDREEKRWKKNEREADKGVSKRCWETDKDIETEQEWERKK